MAWSQRVAYAPFEVYTRSQLGEGGGNRTYNCVPTSFDIVGQVLGGPYLRPESLTDAVYGVSYHGATAYTPMLAEVRKRWPGCPLVGVDHPLPTLAAVDRAGELGWPVVCSFWCDATARLTPSITGSLHVCPILEHTESGIAVLNVWDCHVETLSEADFAAATQGAAGWLAIFQRAVTETHVAPELVPR